MPILFVPPTQVVPYNAERLVRHQKAMDEFRAGIVKVWNAAPGEETKFGAFRRARLYDWQESYDGLLQTYFIFPGGAKSDSGELAKIAVLIRKDTCQLLGSSMVWGSEWSSALPSGLSGMDVAKIKEAASRKFDNLKSPVRLTLETFGYWGPALAWTTESTLAEKLSSQGVVVHSDLSGLACFKEIKKSDKQGDNPSAKANTAEPVLKRGHRQVRIRLEGLRPKEPQKWPQVSGKASFFSLPFNSLLKSKELSADKSAPFHPEKIAGIVSQELGSMLHPLSEKNIKISKRDGRFVVVERGIAWGLKIGMHLSGPDGAELHVIRFEASSSAEDSAILLIRKESATAPLAVGANLQIDARSFPLKN
ncbi:hypothetical protein EBR21_09310 [bacterium]|nr:hypothetical protein [bacterium]